MKEHDHKLSRREFTNAALAASAASVLPFGVMPAWAADTVKSKVFYLQHWASKKYIHPLGGSSGNGVKLVTFHSKSPVSRYYFEFAEGPWGYLVYASNPAYCIHPQGGRVDAADDTDLVVHQGRHPGCYFSIDQENNQIVHISGRYWHPMGGSSQPEDDNRIVLFHGFRDATKFVPTDLENPQVSSPFDLELPVTAEMEWRLVFSDDHPLADRTHEYKTSVGLKLGHKSKASIGVTVALKMEGKVFGQKSSASTEIKASYEQEDSKTWSESKDEIFKITVKAGEPVAVWQRVYKASFPDGTVFNFFSAKVTYDTVSSKIKPPV